MESEAFRFLCDLVSLPSEEEEAVEEDEAVEEEAGTLEVRWDELWPHSTCRRVMPMSCEGFHNDKLLTSAIPVCLLASSPRPLNHSFGF